MQTRQNKTPRCRSKAIGLRLEKEILAFRGLGARLEETVADLIRPVTPRFGQDVPFAAAGTKAIAKT